MSNLTNSILILILTSAILLYTKLPLFFDKDGKPKQFGINSDETILPFYLASLIVGIIAYLVLTFTNINK